MMFEKFHNRVVIGAKLVAVTPIFVGARADSYKPGAINGACIKDAFGRPYIPGSSLKGVLRAFLSNVLDEPVIIDSVVNNAFIKKDDRDKYDTPQKLAEAIVAMSTPVELLFGSQVMAGKIKIADAIPYNDYVKTEVRNGIAIDRDTRTAFGGMLFDTEVIPSGTTFRFSASAENLEPDEADLFGRLMIYFAEGNISVGGRSRAGLGSVELRDVKVTLYSAVQGGFPVSSEIEGGLSGIRGGVVSNVRKID